MKHAFTTTITAVALSAAAVFGGATAATAAPVHTAKHSVTHHLSKAAIAKAAVATRKAAVKAYVAAVKALNKARQQLEADTAASLLAAQQLADQVTAAQAVVDADVATGSPNLAADQAALLAAQTAVATQATTSQATLAADTAAVTSAKAAVTNAKAALKAAIAAAKTALAHV